MDGRDGALNERYSYPLSIPEPLRDLVKMYQKDMHIVSFNQALRTLLETHPEIDKRVRELYALSSTSVREDQPG